MKEGREKLKLWGKVVGKVVRVGKEGREKTPEKEDMP